ncbi:MAG: SspB family protein [Xanthobacteraceae bacterium]
MPEDLIRYDLLAQTALRGVVRTVLADAAKKGLPGDHHFKITFATVAPGVRLSERMRAQYPQAMTIILQHQFWDLAVREDVFDVGLSFGGVPEKLTVPFHAVTAFFDPSVQFGFQFDTGEAESTAETDGEASVSEKPAVAVPNSLAESKKPDPRPAEVAKDEKPSESGAEVVSLDRFRKK